VQAKARRGEEWIIRPAGSGRYRFVRVVAGGANILPDSMLPETNCYPLQSHLRRQIKDVGQVETDEIYVGVDRKGAHFVFPVQAKGGTDKLSVV
jgi:hypothetical protein